jgi:hypothetical protein
LREGNVLIYSINRTEPWWHEVARNLGYEQAIVVSDIRGKGDYCVVNDFYRAYKDNYAKQARSSNLLSAEQVKDVIARCRLLRWLPRRRAAAMALAMADAFDKVLEVVKPAVLLSFPIDRYVSDVLERLACSRNIPYFELTPGVIPGTSMLMYRGALIQREELPSDEMVKEVAKIISCPSYIPSYINEKAKFTKLKFLRIFVYFRLRAFAFKLISILKRDKLNLHYLDSQSFLGHKPKLQDIKIVNLVDWSWQEKITKFSKNRRIFMGLQLFPEASIDYWVDDLNLVDYEDSLVEVAEHFSKAGFQILVKDHPLQFGFRQINFIERLLAIPNVLLLPYEVSGIEVLAKVGANFTFTGTLGLQAALQGIISVVVKNYFSTQTEFIEFKAREDLAYLPARVMAAKPRPSLEEGQNNIVSNFLRGTFNEDLYSRDHFNGRRPGPEIQVMGEVLGAELEALGSKGQAWHQKINNRKKTKVTFLAE